MKIIIKNCSVDWMLSSQRHLIEDSFSENFNESYALRNDGTLVRMNTFNTYYKIPIKAGMLVNVNSTLVSVSPYAVVVLYDNSGTVISSYTDKRLLIKVAQDGFISICCADRTEFEIAEPNNIYETINSDVYLQKGQVLKDDGTLQAINSFFTIYKVPVTQGDNVLFSCILSRPVVSGYCSWCLTDTNDVVQSFEMDSVIQGELIAAQDGYFSCSFNGMINGYVDIISN